MSTSILENAAQKIARFNDEGLHYNLVADEIYKKRNHIRDPFNRPFLQYLIAGLIAFDIGRMMGPNPYASKPDSFASRLNSKLQKIRRLLEPLMKLSLPQIDIQEHRNAIETAYKTLSDGGSDAALHNKQKKFHVGATKILHFLNPELFIIVDSKAARAFRISGHVPFRNTSQPGYSPGRYFECMRRAQIDISTYGLEKFRDLEPDVPLTRIYDKLTFVTGST